MFEEPSGERFALGAPSSRVDTLVLSFGLENSSPVPSIPMDRAVSSQTQDDGP